MSLVADAKKNWLDQVKADAEALTRKRLAEDLPKLEKVAEQLTAHSVPQQTEQKEEDAAAEVKPRGRRTSNQSAASTPNTDEEAK
jgi:hypothetical protein